MPDVKRGRYDGLDAITLAAGELEATFAPGAGMVCCPLLHPWANRLAGWSYEALGRSVDLHRLEGGVVKADGATGLPIHGALPGPWRLVGCEADRIAAEQHPTWEPGFRAAFPFDHRIRLEAELSARELRITTTVTAADARVPVAFGFHPYFTLPGVARADYALELPEMRRLELDERKIPIGEGVVADLSGPLGERDFDDSFAELDGGLFGLSGGGRRIELRFESGYRFAQVF